MPHVALYREFRPQRFADVVGQEHITRTLRNALIHNRIHHAYLLAGPRGTGKTTVARILAKAVNCLNLQDGEPCNACPACRSIMSGESMDVIEIDAASNRGIDEIRDLRDKVKYAPAELRRKVYIIDEVHMLSEPAFNALLKTLEEPPGHAMFILATTEKHKLPVTILSRCQCFDYHRLSAAEILQRLEQVCKACGVEAAADALTAIARHAEGGMRDALSLLDQVMAYAEDGRITLEDTLHVLGSAPLEQFLELDRRLAAGGAGEALLLLDELIRQGKDLKQFVRDYMTHLRDLLLLQVDSRGAALDLPAHALEKLREPAREFGREQILDAIKLLAQLETDLRFTTSPRLLVEVALIRLAGLFAGEAAEARPAPAASAREAAPRPRGGARGPAEAEAPPSAAASEQPGPSATAAGQAAPPAGTAGGAASSPGAQGGAAALKARWAEVLERVRQLRPSTVPLLTQAEVGTLSGRRLILIAPNAVFAGLLKRPHDKRAIETALADIGFAGLEVVPVGPDDPLAKAPEQAAPPAAEPPSRGSLLEAAQRVFPKELVHEWKEEGS
ncbi:MAG TPA: DNA polymerase III subunit gamma/tau [Symbiobacteriaceae bacterium]